MPKHGTLQHSQTCNAKPSPAAQLANASTAPWSRPPPGSLW
jgi:hypothetical protein